MDPLSGGLDIVDAAHLPCWASESAVYDGDGSLSPKFPACSAINRKVALWKGQIWQLNTDAVVNSTNETLSSRSGLCKHIIEAAGADAIKAELEASDGCRTGEAVSTRSCKLPCKRLIHTVGPRYNDKYKTAAENALHNCYRNCIRVAKEEGLRSIAFSPVYTTRKGYPRDAAAHIAVRTVRRFLEHWGEDIDLVVLVVDSTTDLRIYERVLPLYLPRTADEERFASTALPSDTGNKYGETVIEDRKIRVSSLSTPVSRLTDTSRYKMSGRLPSAFGRMNSDQDDQRLEQIRISRMRMSRAELATEETRLEYKQYVRRARGEDLSDIEALNLVYQKGVDNLGRPIVMFVASHLPATTVDMDRVLLYLIKVMDPIVERPYVMIYLHSNIGDENRPELSWLRRMFQLLDRKYKKNVQHIYVVHPSFWVKLVFWFLTPFISNKFWRKLVYVDRVSDLHAIAPHLELPESILRFDHAFNNDSWTSSVGEQSEAIEGPSIDGGGGGSIDCGGSDDSVATAVPAAAAAAASCGGGSSDGGGCGRGASGRGGRGGSIGSGSSGAGDDTVGGGAAVDTR